MPDVATLLCYYSAERNRFKGIAAMECLDAADCKPATENSS